MKPAAAWPLAIVAVLTLTVAANVFLLVAANQPEAGGLEPDYYRRALDWDRTQAERTRSASLRWSANASPWVGSAGERGWQVNLSDSLDEPVEGAALQVIAVHNRMVDRPQHAVLEERSPGVYAGVVPVPLNGLWELRVTAQRGDARFVTALRAEATGAPR